ncbi:MAG: hypothetical protein QOK05_2960 [Chloroflexota bacterium]|jgi:photosystem II stability/assembly factor-like uncharacterized protein|nr:hypothetical protein [Chloroflexota bacterium]
MKKLLAIVASTAAALIGVNATAAAVTFVPSDYTKVSSPSTPNGGPWLFGASWPRQAAPYGYCHIAGDLVNPDGSVATGVIYHDSADAGGCGTQAWAQDTLTPAQAANGIVSISCPGTGLCVAVGGKETILRNSHATGGTNWITERSGGTQNLYGVSCADSRHCVAVGSNGIALYSLDGGITWASGATTTTSNLFSVFCSAATECVATGASGTALRSIDSGASWTPAATLTTKSINASSCYSISCYQAGDATPTGTPAWLAWSNNGGTSWHPATTNPSSQTLLGLDCRNQTACTAAGQQGQLVSTVNGGPAWFLNTKSPATTNEFDAVACSLSAVKCIAVGQGGQVYRG